MDYYRFKPESKKKSQSNQTKSIVQSPQEAYTEETIVQLLTAVEKMTTQVRSMRIEFEEIQKQLRDIKTQNESRFDDVEAKITDMEKNFKRLT